MDTVYCPDCGGVIGGADHDGHKPCVCDPDPIPAAQNGMPEPAPKVRVCCQCGKDVNKKKRYKDSLGYWCEACHYAEKRESKGNDVPCNSCGRYVNPAKLVQYENIKMCSRCVIDRKEASKKVRRPVSFGSEHRHHERKTLYTLLAIMFLLAAIIVLSHYHILPAL